VITIGRLARYVGVTTKTIRVYHDKGLLPEPERDSSGYRRYTAQDAVQLVRVRTLAEAGVPLPRIRELQAAPDDVFRSALAEIDDDLGTRIRGLRATRRRLRELASGRARLLPPEVDRHLRQLEESGFSERWVAMEGDLWVLVFATHPDLAPALLRDEARALLDPALRQIHLDYDGAHDLDPRDPFLADLARRIVDATIQRYGTGDLPGQATGSEVPQLVQDAVNVSSPAWRRLDALVRDQLRRAGADV
jgi:DNA-binding transcriptional MerR regulator